jgi:hypothetical protein
MTSIWLQRFLGGPMGHSKAEKTKTHKRIVAIAARKFREEGLAGVGIAELMNEAGLTAGRILSWEVEPRTTNYKAQEAADWECALIEQGAAITQCSGMEARIQRLHVKGKRTASSLRRRQRCPC